MSFSAENPYRGLYRAPDNAPGSSAEAPLSLRRGLAEVKYLIETTPPNNHTDIESLRQVEKLLKDPKRNEAVRSWIQAPAVYQPYEATDVRDPKTGKVLYNSGAGEILLINDKQVMSSGERGWSLAAIDLAVKKLQETRGKELKPIGFFELGWGQGFAARRALQQINVYGGWYDAVELNRDVFRKAKEWEELVNKQHHETARIIPGGEPKPATTIYHGDAILGLLARAKKIREGKEQRANVLLMDMFPVTPEDEGKGEHDAVLAVLAKMCLEPYDSILIWYPYFEGFEGTTNAQRALLNPHFSDMGELYVPNHHEGFPTHVHGIRPHPDYTYMFNKEGKPIESLPVGWCRYPKGVDLAA